MRFRQHRLPLYLILGLAVGWGVACSKEEESPPSPEGDGDDSSSGGMIGEGGQNSMSGGNPGTGGVDSAGGTSSGGASSGGSGMGGGPSTGGMGGDEPVCMDDDEDQVCNEDDICEGHDDLADEDSDSVPDGCDICPGSDDAVDTDGDSVPNGCDQCFGEDDTVDIDVNGVADCFENLLDNGQFILNVDDWTPSSVTTLTWRSDNADGVMESGSFEVRNDGLANFQRDGYQTVNHLPATVESQLVTFGAQYALPSGQEPGEVFLQVDYYATSCSGASMALETAPAVANAWGTVIGKTVIPAGVTCMTLRLYTVRASAAQSVGDHFRVLFDNVLLSRCSDADENGLCD